MASAGSPRDQRTPDSAHTNTRSDLTRCSWRTCSATTSHAQLARICMLDSFCPPSFDNYRCFWLLMRVPMEISFSCISFIIEFWLTIMRIIMCSRCLIFYSVFLCVSGQSDSLLSVTCLLLQLPNSRTFDQEWTSASHCHPRIQPE